MFSPRLAVRALSVALACFSSGATVEASPRQRGSVAAHEIADWTILVMVNADSETISDEADHLDALAKLPWSSRVRCVVLLDQYKRPHPVLGAPGVAGGLVYASEPRSGRLRQVARLRGEPRAPASDDAPLDPDLGSASYLDLLLRLGKTCAPARRTCLWMIGHGHAWRGLMSDDSHVGSLLTLGEFEGVLKRDLLTGCQRRMLDLLVLDVCGLANAELLARVAGAVSWLVAPQGLIAQRSVLFDPALRELCRDPGLGEDALGRRIVETFQDERAMACDRERWGGILSLVDVTRTPALLESGRNLLRAATGDWQVARLRDEEVVCQGYRSAGHVYCDDILFTCSRVGEGRQAMCCMRDVHGAADATARAGVKGLEQPAVQLRDACASSIRCLSAGPDAYDLQGLAVFFPCFDADVEPYMSEPLAVQTGWGRFLERQVEADCLGTTQPNPLPLTVDLQGGKWDISTPVDFPVDALEGLELRLRLPNSDSFLGRIPVAVGPALGTPGKVGTRWDGGLLCVEGVEGRLLLNASHGVTRDSQGGQVLLSRILLRNSVILEGRELLARVYVPPPASGRTPRLLGYQPMPGGSGGIVLRAAKAGDVLSLPPDEALRAWWASAKPNGEPGASTVTLAVPRPLLRFAHANVSQPAKVSLELNVRGRPVQERFASGTQQVPSR